MTSLKATNLEELTFPEFMRLAVKRLLLLQEDPQRTLWLQERPEQLHKILLQLRDRLQDRLPPLRDLHFITAGPFPYSGDVVEALDLLQQSNAISRANPDYQRFSPKYFADTRDVVNADVQTLFGANQPAKAAFEEFVHGLEAVIASP